jgi:hypothetical protein
MQEVNAELYTHPRRLISTTCFRDKKRDNRISGRPAEVHYIFYLQGFLIKKGECISFIDRNKILPQPCKIFIIFSTAPPSNT